MQGALHCLILRGWASLFDKELSQANESKQGNKEISGLSYIISYM
jgi:hypothetical protein